MEPKSKQKSKQKKCVNVGCYSEAREVHDMCIDCCEACISKLIATFDTHFVPLGFEYRSGLSYLESTIVHGPRPITLGADEMSVARSAIHMLKEGRRCSSQ